MKLDGLTVADVLRVEGTDRYEVLTYLLFTADSDMELALADCHSLFSGSSNTVTHLTSDGWPAEIVLVETVLKDPRVIPGSVAAILQKALGGDHCCAAISMFDGAFYSFGDILSREMAGQTYAFSLQEGAEVVAMSTAVLTSRGWAEIIGAQQASLPWLGGR